MREFDTPAPRRLRVLTLLIAPLLAALVTGSMALVPAHASLIPGFTVSVTVTSPAAGQIRLQGRAIDNDEPLADLDLSVRLSSSGGSAERHSLGSARSFDTTLATGAEGLVGVQLFATNHPGTPGGSGKVWEDFINVVGHSPRGKLEQAAPAGPGRLSVAGWAADGDAPTAPVSTELLIDGQVVGTVLANQLYPGLTWVLGPNYGNDHRFVAEVVAAPGIRKVCARALNLRAKGDHTDLGCLDVEVQSTPETTIAGTEMQGKAHAFLFASSEAGSTFECQWDGGPWRTCVSPDAQVLPNGDHTFAVRAINRWGHVDPTPATRGFTVSGARGDLTEFSLVLGVKAVKKKGRLRIAVRPRSTSDDYRFVVQKKRKKKWRTVKRSRTRGKNDIRVLNLRKGRYRVVLPDQRGLLGTTSETVRLKR